MWGKMCTKLSSLNWLFMCYSNPNQVYSQLSAPNENDFGSESSIWAFMLFFFICVINIQFLPGKAAVITHRLGNSDCKHTAQQKKVLVLRQENKLSQLPSWGYPRGFVVNPSALTRTISVCPPFFLGGGRITCLDQHAGRLFHNLRKTIPARQRDHRYLVLLNIQIYEQHRTKPFLQ